jgi:hypothetical protein
VEDWSVRKTGQWGKLVSTVNWSVENWSVNKKLNSIIFINQQAQIELNLI